MRSQAEHTKTNSFPFEASKKKNVSFFYGGKRSIGYAHPCKRNAQGILTKRFKSALQKL